MVTLWKPNRRVIQLVEWGAHTAYVAGSSPAPATTFSPQGHQEYHKRDRPGAAANVRDGRFRLPANTSKAMSKNATQAKTPHRAVIAVIIMQLLIAIGFTIVLVDLLSKP